MSCCRGVYIPPPVSTQIEPLEVGIISENEINLFNLHLKCFFFTDNYVYGNMVSRQCQGSPSHAHVYEFILTQFIPKLCYTVHKLAQE